ncbi:hypothetical protein [Pseudovibrio sp. FO-BEG1]|uniref:hypothetical protein n=1 Tax=Pseudovibrio sp. (strain FO-BEG1) TaxID=911045 RepID=UPI0005A2ED13|nr:hypothetical protein [Pseudovibrio sp. FO-BEG1]
MHQKHHMASHAVLELKFPEDREEQGGRQHLRYLLDMSLRHWLRALPGHFGMANIASYPERHDSQFPGKIAALLKQASRLKQFLYLRHQLL